MTTALFVGGPKHGTIHTLPDPAPLTYVVPVVTHMPMATRDDPLFMADTSATLGTAVYTRRQYATVEADGMAVMEVWTYDGTPEPAYQETADAALRVLVRHGLLDHRFHDLSHSTPGGTPGQQRADLAQRERCTPEPQPRPEPPQDPATELAQAIATALADNERHMTRMANGIDCPVCGEGRICPRCDQCMNIDCEANTGMCSHRLAQDGVDQP